MKNLLLSLLITLSFVNSYGQAAVESVVFDLQYYGGGYNVRCHGGLVDIEPTFIGAVHPFTCTWFNDTGAVVSQSPNLTGVAVGLGRYTLEITKGSWTGDYDVYLTEPDQLILSLEASNYNGYNISEHGVNDGVINSHIEGGIPPYTYVWSNGSSVENIENLYAGTYSLTITDAGGCTKTQSKVLIEPTQLHVTSISSPTHHGYNVSCKGGHNGAINLSVTGGTPPYTYYWSSGDTTKDIDSVLTAHLYTVIITDNNNASIIKSITLTEPSELSVTLTPSVYGDFNLSCHICNNGSITANVTGGVPPYTYAWSNTQTTQTISNLSARVYSVTVRDAHGASMAKEISLTAPDRDDWSMSGNGGTDSTTQFIGTTDNKPVVIKTNNFERMRFHKNGNIVFNGSVKMDELTITRPLKIDTLKINRIMAQDGDSVINFGRGSVHMNDYNEIWGTQSPTSFCYLNGVKGMGIGAFTFGENNNSLALGTYVKSRGVNSITIGSGPPLFGILNWCLDIHYLINQIDNSLAIGFRSSTPTFFISTSPTSTGTGNVGIGGTTSPGEKLQVDDGNVLIHGVNNFTSTAPADEAILKLGNSDHYIKSKNGVGVMIGTTTYPDIINISSTKGIVGIGIDPAASTTYFNPTTNYKMLVGGTLGAKEIWVALGDQTHPWPDYVYDKNHKSKSLAEIRKFVFEKKHLPNIPSANEIKKAGAFNIGEIQLNSVLEIEELYLQVFKLSDRIDELEKQNQELIKLLRK